MHKAIAPTNNITQGVIWKQLLRYFLPIMLGTLFQQLYNTADAIVVGNVVGKEALAAVGGSTGSTIDLLIGLFVGLSSGATVAISQFYGAGDRENVSRGVHCALTLALLSGAALMGAGLAFAPKMLGLLKTPAEVVPPATIYLRIYFLGIIPNVLYNFGAGILRAIGDSRRPLYILICACLLNVVLDILFVWGLRMGVAGAAYATILSQAVSCVLVLAILMKTSDSYKLILRKLRLHWDLLRRILMIGLPTGVQALMYALSNLYIQLAVNSYGTDIAAAWTALGKIDGLNWMIMNAFGIAITTFVGQNVGAGRIDRVRTSVRTCVMMATAFSVAFGMGLYFWGEYVFRLFTKDAAVVVNGVAIMRMICPFYFTYVLIEIFSGTMRGSGEALVPMLLTMFGICLFRSAWVFAVTKYMPSIYTVVISYPASWSLTSILYTIYYFKGGWRQRARNGGLRAESGTV